MAYHHVVEMSRSMSLRGRIMGCAALEGALDPEDFTRRNIMRIVASPTWATEWETAINRNDPKFNPDTGARTDVITDGMILSSVQPLVQAENASV